MIQLHLRYEWGRKVMWSLWVLVIDFSTALFESYILLVGGNARAAAIVAFRVVEVQVRRERPTSLWFRKLFKSAVSKLPRFISD